MNGVIDVACAFLLSRCIRLSELRVKCLLRSVPGTIDVTNVGKVIKNVKKRKNVTGMINVCKRWR